MDQTHGVPFIIWDKLGIREWMSKIFDSFVCDVITHPYPNHNVGLTKLLLKLGMDE